jgi:glycosyltransferase involved in cell wall biosynthesis
MATIPTTERIPISVLIHTRDAAATLGRALASVAWAAERVVIDMESRDETRAIAERAGARVVGITPTPRVDDVRTAALAEARHEWILVLDADEYLAADADAAVQALLRAHGAAADAFAIPRFNAVAGRILRGTGWYPDHQVRLFRRGCVHWPGGVHRPPEVTTGAARLHRLEPPGCLHLHHDNYASVTAVIERQLRYALIDDYSDDPAAFDFGEYVQAAYAELAQRHDPERDGDLSTALALVMAWHALVRGLVHWDRLAEKPPLEPAFCLPIVPAPPAVAARATDPDDAILDDGDAAIRELARWQRTRWYRLARFCERRMPALLRVAKAVAARFGL